MSPPTPIRILVAVLVTYGLFGLGYAAVADPGSVGAEPDGNGIVVGGNIETPPSLDLGNGGSASSVDDSGIRYVSNPVCSTGGDPGGAAVCNTQITCEGEGGPGQVVSIDIIYPDGSIEPGGTACSTDQISGSAPVLTPGDVLSAFRRMELPESQIVVQPPGGETLVNFDTIFSTEASTERQRFTLLGLQVEIEAEPSEFEWAHGDGTVQSTDWPGREFAEGVAMERYISHRYADAHVTVEPSVDTVWSARFRVDGGAWQPVVGTVEIAGDPSSLRVVEGQPNLVG